MTDISNQNHSGRNRVMAQLIGLVAAIALLMVGVTNFLNLLVTECLDGTPILSGLFLCFAQH